MPSTSAHFDQGFDEYGAYGYIVERLNDLSNYNDDGIRYGDIFRKYWNNKEAALRKIATIKEAKKREKLKEEKRTGVKIQEYVWDEEIFPNREEIEYMFRYTATVPEGICDVQSDETTVKSYVSENSLPKVGDANSEFDRSENVSHSISEGQESDVLKEIGSQLLYYPDSTDFFLSMGLGNELQFMEYEPKVNKVFEYKGPTVLKRRDSKKLKELIFKDFPSLLQPLPVDFKSKLNYPDSHMISVKTYAICEPLKVRMITKGESLPYYYSKYFQKGMFKYLRKFPQLSLVGESVTTQHIHDLISRHNYLRNKNTGKTSSLYHPLNFTKWVSGDYSAATDSIALKITMTAFEALLASQQIPEEEKNILRSVIYASKVHYPKESSVYKAWETEWNELDKKKSKLKDDIEFFIRQKCGQLMGSPLSFPILCIVNLVSYSIALHTYLTEEFGIDTYIPFEELPVLVNGDDILFLTNDIFYKYWIDSITKVGFQLSIGKNYIHESLLTINSQCFEVTGSVLTDPSNLKIEMIPFLNIGLMTGQSKLRARDKTELLPFEEWYNKVVAGALDPVQAHKYFLYYHRDRVNICTQKGKYNLFISRNLGGCGFHKPEGLDVEYNDFHLHLACYLFRLQNGTQGTKSLLNELNFRPMVSLPELKVKAKPDYNTYGRIIVPHNYDNEDLKSTFLQTEWGVGYESSNLTDHLFSRQAFGKRDTLNVFLKFKEPKRSFWRRFNEIYSKIKPFTPNLVSQRWNSYDLKVDPVNYLKSSDNTYE
jgi:hypothetical protein